jgi:Na+/H+ antiporter NhaA
VSLFIAGLAFADPVLVDAAKVAILVASVISAVVGSALLVVGAAPPTRDLTDVGSKIA